MVNIKYTHRYYPNENSPLYIRAFVEDINENAQDGRFYGIRLENGNFVWTWLKKIKLIEERNGPVVLKPEEDECFGCNRENCKSCLDNDGYRKK